MEIDTGAAVSIISSQSYKSLFPKTTLQKAHLHLKEGVAPKFCRPRKVPFAIKESVGKELDRLEEAGIIIKENYSDWAAPIVPVPKQDGSIRVCGDFTVTINPGLNVDQYLVSRCQTSFLSAGHYRFQYKRPL